jgi:phage-related protein
VVILHGFVKKTQKSPGKDIDVARARIRQVKARG